MKPQAKIGGGGWRSATIFITLLSMIAVLSGDPLSAARPVNPDLQRIRGEIRNLRGKLAQVQKRAKSVEQELQATELELEIIGRELEAAESVRRDLERQNQENAAQIDRLKAEIAKHKHYLASRLAVLYRTGRLSYLRMFLLLQDSHSPIAAASMLAYLAGRDARSVAGFREANQLLEIETRELAEREERVKVVVQVAAERRLAASRKRAEKSRLLRQLEREQQRSAARLAELEEKAQRLERLLSLLYAGDRSEQMEAHIEDFKGALGWPVEGEIIESFGKRRSTEFATYVVSNGIKIATPPGTEVRAIYTGTVLFNQWFRGYGNLLIVDHGNRVFSLYGNTRGSTLEVGARVSAGQVVAVVGEDEESGDGYLYFEIRENNKPTDPRVWLR